MNQSPAFPTMKEDSARSCRPERAVNTFLLVVLVFFSLCYLYHAIRLIEYPHSIDYGEGFVLNQGNELANFRSPYQPIDTPPWLVANYPPVYPAVVGVGIKAFGIQFHFGRLLSMLGILTAAFCLYRMVLYETMDRFSSWVAGLAWLCAYPVYNWGTHHRVDSLGIGLEAVGLLLLIRRNHLKASAFVFLLSLYTRQTLIMGPLAGYFFLRRMNGPREAGRWFGGLLLAGGLVFGAMTLLTGGEFARHLIVYNANEYNLKDVWRMFTGAVMTPMKIPSLFMFFFLIRSISMKRWDLPAICAPFSILTFFLIGKLGSATNYLYEFSFVSSWACGLIVAETRELVARGNYLRQLPAFFLAMGVLFPLHFPHAYGPFGVIDWGGTPVSASSQLTTSLVERLKKFDGPVFVQDAGLSLLSGHPLVWQPFVMTQLSQQNRWDIAPFHKKIRNKEFEALVLPIDLGADPEAWTREEWWSQFPVETARVIHENYRVEPRMKPPLPEGWRSMDPRLLRGYLSPFWTNYLYLPR